MYGKVWYTDINLYYAIAAYKGALALEKLEEYTDKEAFYKSLREFFEEYRFRDGDLNEFVAILEKNSGKPVKNLITTPDCPNFDFYIFHALVRLSFKYLAFYLTFK